MPFRLSLVLLLSLFPTILSVCGQDKAAPNRILKLDARDNAWKSANDARSGGLFAAGAKAAIKQANRVLEIEQDLFGADAEELIRTRGFLADCHEELAQFDSAKPHREEILRLTQKHQPANHFTIFDARNAISHLQILQSLSTQQRKALAHAESTIPLAFQLSQDGESNKAIQIMKRNLKQFQEILGPEHIYVAASMNNLGEIYVGQDKADMAKPLFQKSLKILEKTCGPEHPDMVTCLTNLAKLYLDDGDAAQAESMFESALRISETTFGADDLTTAACLDGLGSALMFQGNYVGAQRHKRRALTIREKNLDPQNSLIASSLNNLAEVYRLQENYAESERICKKAIALHEAASGADHPRTAVSINNLGTVYTSERKYVAAISLHSRALMIRETSLGSSHPDTAESLSNLAVAYYLQERNTVAEPLIERAVRIWQNSRPDHPHTASGLNNLAHVQWQLGLPSAAEYSKQALRIVLRHLDLNSAFQTEDQQSEMSREVQYNFDTRLTTTTRESVGMEKVYGDALIWKGLITSRQRGLRRDLKNDPLFADFVRAAQQLSNVSLNPPLPPEEPLATNAWKTREPELRRNWESRKAKFEAEHHRLEKELAVKSAAFRESLEQRCVQPEDLIATLKMLGSPIALVDLLEYQYRGRKDEDEVDQRRIVAFIVCGDQPVVRVEIGAADSIGQQLVEWRESILRKGEGKKSGEELRRSVWLPLEAHLKGIETVLISTDGVLGCLPFEALPGKAEGTLLIEEYRLAFVPVPQFIPGLLAKPQSSVVGEEILLVGDVDYGTNAAGEQRPWRPLVGTADELTALSKLYTTKFPAAARQLALRGKDATERNVIEQLAQFPVLHFATHGLFEQTEQRVIPTSHARGGMRSERMTSAFEDGPQTVQVTRSGLVLSGANCRRELPLDGAESKVPEDGLMMDSEILAMPLENASLVVMSACDTAQGKQQSGEGLLGIQRAFQVAGARTTVASLWQVNDAATVLLMQRFYENLWSGNMSRVDSLREAQLWMLRSGKQALRDSASRAIARGDDTRGLRELIDDIDATQNDNLPPYYWAAFQLSGDWR